MHEEKTMDRRKFLQSSFVVTGLGITSTLYSCSKSDVGPKKPDEGDDQEPGGSSGRILISNIDLPSRLYVKEESEFSIYANGFKKGDKIEFTSLTGSTRDPIVLTSIDATNEYIVCLLPKGFLSDGYQIMVKRGNDKFLLGRTNLYFVFNPNIPDKEGMTVKGVVHAEGKALEGVVISDGFEVTKTDKDGIYYLPSAKKTKYVFVSIPRNYEVGVQDENSPIFFNRLSLPNDQVEIKDFELFSVQNDEHVVMMLGDMHLANRNNDTRQFQDGFVRDVNQSIEAYKSAGKKVYALTMGDMSWDTYWYGNPRYTISEYYIEKKGIKSMIFHTIGNHDNDPNYRHDDWGAADRYRSVIGPTYYSFNLGKVHYVVLDNIEYINDTREPRGYNAIIEQEQLDWLKKDLAMVADKNMPLVIAMHIQLKNNPTVSGANGELESSSWRISNYQEFLNTLSGFTDVHLVTGHTHMKYNIQVNQYVREHNIAAVCATWWWTGRDGYAGNHTCKDGTPGGYDIWEINGNSIKWRYKSIGHDKNYQFRTFDLNKVHITREKYASKFNGTTAEWNSFAGGYSSPNTNNEVLINVWDFAHDWTVEVKENGQSLPVKRVRAKDPLHVISYNALRLNANATPTSAFASGFTAHMFKVVASSPTSTLEIKVTDGFGNVYTETMVRPKELGYLMT